MNDQYAVVIFILGTLLLVLLAFTLIIFLVIHKRKQFENSLEKQAMEGDYQNQLLQTRLEVQEQSFKYFSEEIHDNIGQLLSIVKMQLHNIKGNTTEPEIVIKANASAELLGKAISDLRNVSHTLNNTYVDNVGLYAAIQKDLDYIQSAKDLKCSLQKLGNERHLGMEQELLVFRVVQEATANAIKHANPTEIDICLEYTTRHFQVQIRDNGSGFDLSKVKSQGLGLSNMQVRAKLLKGDLFVQSEVNKGTVVTLSVSV